MKGRKRHLAVDTLGLLVAVVVHPANWSDKSSARLVLRRVPLFSRWALLLLDAGYDSPALLDWCQRLFGIRVEVVRRTPASSFHLLPKRWIVERTFAWLGKQRRLSKDYEQLPFVTENWIYLSMTHLMLRRLAS